MNNEVPRGIIRKIGIDYGVFSDDSVIVAVDELCPALEH